MAGSEPALLHVSPSGSDSTGDGSVGRPFGSVARAQLSVRQLLRQNTSLITVSIAAGRYFNVSLR